MASSSTRSSSSRSAVSKSKGEKGGGSYASGKTKRGRQDVSDDGWGGMGGYMNARKQKLNDQFFLDKEESRSNIFEGVRIYINGYTKPSSDELRRIMQKHGGKHEMYLSKSRVTHIVATNLPNSKLHLAKTMPVVKPEWIIDSVAAGKRLPHVDYLLFGNQSKLQPSLKFFPSTSSATKSSSMTSSHAEDSSPFTQVIDKASTYDEENAAEYTKEEKIIGDQENGEGMQSERKSSVNKLEDWKGHLQHCSENVGDVKESELMNNFVTVASKREGRTYNDVAVSLLVRPSCKQIQNEKSRERVQSSDEENEIVYGSEDESYASPVKLNVTNFPVRSQRKFSDSSYSVQDSVCPDRVKKERRHDSLIRIASSDDHIDSSSICVTMEKEKSQVSTEDCDKNKVSDEISEKVDSDRHSKGQPQDLIESKTPKSSHSPQKATSLSTSSSSSTAKAGDKGFLSEFYSNSRLHHISTWGAEFKAYVAEIQKVKADSFPGRERLRQAHIDNASRLGMEETLETARHSIQERTVMHVDMDCFFVSVGLLARPDLRGKPVAVTHSRGQGQGSKPTSASDAAWEKAEWHKKRDGKLKTQTSPKGNVSPHMEYDFLVPEGSSGTQTFQSFAEIASCSYEARQKGVKNGMFMGRARSFCADLQTIPYNFAEYNRISKILYDTVASYTHDIEAVSCDEMLVDCTDLLSDTGATALEFASLLRSEMMDKTGCPASTGIGPNILLARLATRKAKPNGQFQVLTCDAKNFIKDQNVSNLPGVGYSMTRKLDKLDVKTCGDLQAVPVSRLRTEFGPKTGESLHQFSLGHDDREVKGDKQRKSVSAEVNYGMRFTKESEAISFFQELANEVQERLLKLKVKGQSITLKLMIRRPDAPQEAAKFMGHGICNNITKSTNLPVATNDGRLIGREVIAMYKSHNVSAADIRGIGIQMQKLEQEGAKGFVLNKQTTGHQSILNFAVAGKESIQVPTASSSTSAGRDISASSSKSPVDSRRGPDVSKKLDLNCGAAMSAAVEKKEKRASSSSDFFEFHRISGGKSDGEKRDNSTRKNPNSIKATRDIVVSDQIDFNSLTDVSFLLSPSQVNSEVLNELPEDIADEIRAGIQQHDRHKGFPALTSTPVHGQGRSSRADLSLEDQPGPSHNCSHSALKTYTADREEEKTSNAIVDFSSLSQVNVEVLNELPDDIAEEIRTGIEQRERLKSLHMLPSTSAVDNGSDLDTGPSVEHRPGPGHASSSAIQDVSNGDRGESISELPSMSQALPKHMQIELQAAYTKRTTPTTPHGSEVNRAIMKNTALGQLKSPSKERRSKQSKTGKKRGRPSGKKKLAFVDQTSNVSPMKQKPSLHRGLDDDDDADIIILDEPEMVHSSSENDVQPFSHQDTQHEVAESTTSTTKTSSSVAAPVITFCGAETVFDVRHLLKEWLSSSEDPGEDDVTMVAEYLISLVKARFLEQAFCHLRFLRRRVNSLPNRYSWRESVDNIACHVQSSVWDLYGSHLKLF